MLHHIDILEKIFYIIFPLTAIVLTGFIYAKKYNPDMTGINQMNIDVFCPALVFSVVSAKTFNIAAYQSMAVGAALIVLGSGLVALPICKRFNISLKTLAPPMMFNNSGNMGLPLIVLAFGEKALPIGVVLFIVENTLHFTVGVYIMNHRSNPFAVLKMPMISITLLALVFSYFQLTLPEPVTIFISMLGQICLPLMLFALGVRMVKVNFSDWKIGLLGAILTPLSGLVVLFVMSTVWSFTRSDFNYLLLFSVLPPAVLNYMIAEKYKQEQQRVASIVLIGNLFSIITIPIALFFIYQGY